MKTKMVQRNIKLQQTDITYIYLTKAHKYKTFGNAVPTLIIFFNLIIAYTSRSQIRKNIFVYIQISVTTCAT